MSLTLYHGKHLLELMPNGHKYLVDGEERPGVTSILSLLNKPGLPQWAANQAVASLRENSRPFPMDGQEAWIVTDYDLRRARTAFNMRRDSSADVGKKVHGWIESHIKAQLEGLTSKEPYGDDMKASVESFLEWEEIYKPKYIFSERSVFSEKGGYCGTTDLGMIINHEGKESRCILDFKTGKPENEYDRSMRAYTGRKRPYSTVFIQDALYDMAIEEEDGIKSDLFGALYLSTNGDLLFGLTAETDAFRHAGESIVTLFNAMRDVDALNQWMT